MAKPSSALVLIAAALQQCGQQLADGQVTCFAQHMVFCERCQIDIMQLRKPSLLLS